MPAEQQLPPKASDENSNTAAVPLKSILEQIVEDMQDQLRTREALSRQLVERLGVREGAGILAAADTLVEAIRAAVSEEDES